MQRSKVFAVTAALLGAVVGGLVLAGSASAAEWHLYKGDMYAGHAYALDVPPKADSIEFTYEGPANGTARLALHDPEGKKIGYYALTPEAQSATIASPAAGRNVVYVYEITAGALKVRVNAAIQPVLDVQEIRLVREDVAVGTFEAGRLEKTVTTTLKASPVFLTLLYEGSARNLDATVASPKGDVAIVRGESATAFSPGVWTTLSGERRFEPANLDGTTYTVTMRADEFQGSVVLTTLAVPGKAPAAPGREGNATTDGAAAAPDPWAGATGGIMALREGKAYAFAATPGTLLLADPTSLEDNHRKDRDDRSDDRDRFHNVVSVYTPDDRLLAHIDLHSYDDDEATAEVELPVEGEYVIYVHRATNEVVLAKLAGAAAAPALRELALATKSFEFSAESLLFGLNKAQAFDLDRVPVALDLEVAEASMGALSMVHVSNERGDVAGLNALVLAPGMRELAWSWESPENFRAGEHELRVDGVFDGKLVLTATTYVRGASAPAAVAAPEPVAEEEDDASKPPMPPAPPGPPAVPLGRAFP